MKEVLINSNDAGQRFDKFLAKYLSGANTGFIYKMLRKKNITLNGKKSDGKDILNNGDIVKIFFSDETFEKFHNSNNSNEQYINAFKLIKGVKVVYENDNVIFINKPIGVLSQLDNSHKLSINEWIIGHLLSKNNNLDLTNFKPSICNRLDMNTEGLVIGAKTYQGSRTIGDAIKGHKLRKIYLAMCEGIINEELTLEGYLYKSKDNNKVTIKSNGEAFNKIKTIVRPIKAIDSNTLIEVELITGKSHQIRAHLSSIGHPLCGDIKYGGHSYKGINHQLLHAYKVVFPHDIAQKLKMERDSIISLPKWNIENLEALVDNN